MKEIIKQVKETIKVYIGGFNNQRNRMSEGEDGVFELTFNTCLLGSFTAIFCVIIHFINA